jgi:hypothetical protein
MVFSTRDTCGRLAAVGVQASVLRADAKRSAGATPFPGACLVRARITKVIAMADLAG